MSLLLTVLWVSQVGAFASTAETEWVLKQTYADLGAQTVYIAHDGVKIDCATHGFSVVCKAPDWRVYCYRPVDKKIWFIDLDAFNGVLLLNPFSTAVYKPGFSTRKGALDYAGVKCFEIRPPTEKFWIAYVNESISREPKVCEFLNRYYYMQNSGCVPLYKKILNAENKRYLTKEWLTSDITADLRTQARVVLDTTNVKKIPYRAGDFDVPKNMVRVKTANDILVSRDDKQQIDDMVDSLGFVSDFKANSKPKH